MADLPLRLRSGIVGHYATIASVFWIFMQAIVSQERALRPHTAWLACHALLS